MAHKSEDFKTSAVEYYLRDDVSKKTFVRFTSAL